MQNGANDRNPCAQWPRGLRALHIGAAEKSAVPDIETRPLLLQLICENYKDNTSAELSDLPQSQQFPILGSSACVWREGKVLLIQRGKEPDKGLWSLPGGKVEMGETVAIAAVREVLEETGVCASMEKLVGIYDVIKHNADGSLQAHYVIACHNGLFISGDAVANSDADAVAWVDPYQLNQMQLAPGIAQTIADAMHILNL